MDIQRFVDRHHPQERIFHSNAYARVAHGGSMGSTDSQTFQQRLDIHHNRQEVGHYGSSMIGRAYLGDRSRSATPQRQPGGVSSGSRQYSQGSSRGAITPTIRPHFQEPPGRGYNPYG